MRRVAPKLVSVGGTAALTLAGGAAPWAFLGAGPSIADPPGDMTGRVELLFTDGGRLLPCCLWGGGARLPRDASLGALRLGGGLRRTVPRRGGDLQAMPGRGGGNLPAGGAACAGIMGGGRRRAAWHSPEVVVEPTSSGSTDMALVLRDTSAPAAPLESCTPL